MSVCEYSAQFSDNRRSTDTTPMRQMPYPFPIVYVVSWNLHTKFTLGFRDRASWANCEVRGKTNKMQQLDVYYRYLLNMFRASLCPSSGEQDVCYCVRCTALVLLDVVGSGCGALRSNSNLHSARTLQRSALQPLPTTTSRTSAVHHMQ